jgi:hypothetical protein
MYTKANGMPKIDLNFFLTCPLLYSVAAALAGFVIMEIVSRLGLFLVGARTFGEGDSYIAAGIGAVFGALLGCSPTRSNFLLIFEVLIGILVLSVVIQLILTLPIFIKKLFTSKNWKTLIALDGFITYTIIHCLLWYNGLLTKQPLYWTSTAILLLLGLYTCKKLICGLKNNNAANGLYLPFGPSMIIAGFIALFTIAF